MIAADDIHKYFSMFFSEKIRLDVASESSARQRIHMNNQALFSSKDKSKKLKCRLLQFLFGALRIKFDAKLRPQQCQSDNNNFLSFVYTGNIFFSNDCLKWMCLHITPNDRWLQISCLEYVKVRADHSKCMKIMA